MDLTRTNEVGAKTGSVTYQGKKQNLRNKIRNEVDLYRPIVHDSINIQLQVISIVRNILCNFLF